MKTNFQREACAPFSTSLARCGGWAMLCMTATLPAFSQTIDGCSQLNISHNVADGYYQLVVVQGPRGYINEFSFVARHKGGASPTVHVQVHTDFASISSTNLGIMKTVPLYESDYATNTVGIPMLRMQRLTNVVNDCNCPNDFYLFTAPIQKHSNIGTWFVWWIKTTGWEVPPLTRPFGAGLKVYQACRYQEAVNVWRYWFKPLPAVGGYYAPVYLFNYKPMLTASYTSQTITMTWPEGLTNLCLSNGRVRISVTGSSWTLPATNNHEFFWLEEQ